MVEKKNKKEQRIENFFVVIITSILCVVLIGILVYLFPNSRTLKISALQTANKGVEQGQIVMVGDSLVEYCDNGRFYKDAPQIINRGIAGLRSDELLKGIDKIAFGLKPKTVIILIGTNDINRGASSQAVLDNILGVVKKVKNSGTMNIYVQSLYPINSNYVAGAKKIVAKRTNEQILTINQLLEAKAAEEGYEYIDMHSVLVGVDGQLRAEYCADGLHVNSVAYEVISKKIKESVL